MNNYPSFSITFEDNSAFSGDSLKGDWNLIPDQKIKSMVFSYGRVTLFLAQYEAYGHFLQNVCMMGQGTKITKFFIVGRKKNGSDLFHFDLKQNSVTRIQAKKGEEFGTQVVTGWKTGLENLEATFSYL